MKVIVAGSRDIIDVKMIEDILDSLTIPITELVCGEASGVDSIAKDWAIARNIPVKSFPADWKRDGKKVAGFKRNEDMGAYGDALVAIWNGTSSGTLDMIKRAKKHKLYIDIYDQSQIRLF